MAQHIFRGTRQILNGDILINSFLKKLCIYLHVRYPLLFTGLHINFKKLEGDDVKKFLIDPFTQIFKGNRYLFCCARMNHRIIQFRKNNIIQALNNYILIFIAHLWKESRWDGVSNVIKKSFFLLHLFLYIYNAAYRYWNIHGIKFEYFNNWK